MSNSRQATTPERKPSVWREGVTGLAALWVLGVVVAFVYQLLAALGA